MGPTHVQTLESLARVAGIQILEGSSASTARAATDLGDLMPGRNPGWLASSLSSPAEGDESEVQGWGRYPFQSRVRRLGLKK